jgi:hypothetical protein
MACRWSVANLWADQFCCYAGLQIFVGMGPTLNYIIRVAYRINIPVDEQNHLNQTWRDDFLPTLNGRPPVCVLRMLEDALVSLWDPKTPGFMGGRVS